MNPCRGETGERRWLLERLYGLQSKFGDLERKIRERPSIRAYMGPVHFHKALVSQFIQSVIDDTVDKQG